MPIKHQKEIKKDLIEEMRSITKMIK